MIINLNDTVKVRLTDYGMGIVQKEVDELNKVILSNGGEPITLGIKPDDDGYVKFQLWVLMQTFGNYIRMEGPYPFDLNIVYENTKEETKC